MLDAARIGIWAEAGLAALRTLTEPLPAAALATLFGHAGGLALADGVPLLDRLALGDQVRRGTGWNLRPALRARAARGMESVAQPVESSFGFDDLVLSGRRPAPARRFRVLAHPCAACAGRWGLGHTFSRRRGAVALFRGPPGTGKTMAASVVANAIGLPLYRIDLAGLVSKYIGETEKNLERLFAAAAASDVVLFFDEADALFGKRSEVSDAHDRYANIETSYLLQRIEAQDGAVILATNLQDNIDAAFPSPHRHCGGFPGSRPGRSAAAVAATGTTGAPVAHDLDLGFLAEAFELTGGEIRNVLIAAAHAAARDNARSEWVRSCAPWRRSCRSSAGRCGASIFGPHYRLLRELPP